ncbi:hypothetical protein Slin15195_G113710 [Septoria linicola]|uniref:Uncharacterized protein n=1 Tax=Septoria linicola TaxID=215465 RepID=A0A9Q9EPT1_9PEZI|nr:hypothetical protein Slin14017_G112050 [Septoria linicola]USW58052.1 hypothetical protein Slin15195_G113710 [Septoria linicola]
MAQTPQQRRANAQYAQREQKKMGAPTEIRESLTAASQKAKQKVEKAPISRVWVLKEQHLRGPPESEW